MTHLRLAPLFLSLFLIPACASNADPSSSTDDDGTVDTQSSELATCRTEKCGPRLGLATILCSDGSVGGNTGRCIRTKGHCGWEIRQCPVECSGPIIDCAAPPSGCSYQGGGCVNGAWTCGSLVCDGGIL